MAYFKSDHHFRAFRQKEDNAKLAELMKEAMPGAIARGDKGAVDTMEEQLAALGMAWPNRVSTIWNSPSDVPRNEVEVREMYAHKMPAHGYRIVASQEAFPDWLLQNTETGEYVLAEVEHRSSSFVSHGHEPTGCDLIVCWEHDCHLDFRDVLELFSGTFHKAERPVPVDPDLRLKAFGGYAASRFGKRAVEAGKQKRRPHLKKNLYDDALRRAKFIVSAVHSGMERGLTKTEAVREAAESHGMGESTVWAILKKRGEYGL